MTFKVISDNHDTAVGLRLAGIEGIVAHSEKEVREALTQYTADENVGVVLITEGLVSLCPELIYDLKLHSHRPLVVEIPDRHSAGRSKGNITKYIREAIGVKI